MKMKGAIIGAATLGLAVIVVVSGAAIAYAAEIAAIPWDESNIAVLRSASAADVAKFVCHIDPPGDPEDVPPGWGDTCGVSQFSWARSGNHRYVLVMSILSGGTSSYESLRIYDRNSTGNISEQDEADGIGGYGYRLEDLDGDGKDELLVLDGFGEGPSHAESPLVKWREIYQLRNGKYVEASRRFGNFYDTHILPKLGDLIAKLQTMLTLEARARASAEATMQKFSSRLVNRTSHLSEEESGAISDSEQLVDLEMERDKILRVIGRDPAAGEKEARQWMTNPDPWIRNASVAVFEDLGGHMSELSAMTADKDSKVSSYAKTVQEIESRGAVSTKN